MPHCNTGYCTTLLHNKDVALKGFLHRYRLTRLNHVTLVFSTFLFYASISTSTLHIQHGITHRVANIFNMESEPNFVLSIKQTYLHNKEDSYMHSTDSQCPCLISDLDSMTSCRCHGSLLCQICANRGFA